MDRKSKIILSMAMIAALLTLLLFMNRGTLPALFSTSTLHEPTRASNEVPSQTARTEVNQLSPTGAPWRRIQVLPVFFVPSDEQPPTEQQMELFRKHLELAKERFRVMLKNQDTFDLSPTTPVYRSPNSLDFFKSKQERLGDFVTVELLDYFHVDRHTCPYVFAVVLMNPHDNVPAGGGIPLNAGYNTGGGILEVASYRLDTGDSFQNTLEHELGHTFGLPHVGEAYGLDMQTSPSIMSYNPRNHWKGFTPAEEPGILIPEDLKAISYNKRVFPDFTFDPQTAIPAGYPMVNTVIALYPPVQLPGHPPYEVQVSSENSTQEGSLNNVVPKFIEAPKSTIIENMWVSGDVPEDGWIKITVHFPEEETLTSIVLHSQHGESINRAEAIRVEYGSGNDFMMLTEQKIETPDETVTFSQTKAQQWRFSLKPGSSKRVTIRGMELFDGDVQLYPPLYPYKLWHKSTLGL